MPELSFWNCWCTMMQCVRPNFSAGRATTRSRISNRLRLLPGVDVRSAAARRFRDFCMEANSDHAFDKLMSTMRTASTRGAGFDAEQARDLSAFDATPELPRLTTGADRADRPVARTFSARLSKGHLQG